MGDARRHRALSALPVALLLALSAGCLKVKEQLTIRADGSGTLAIETQCLVPAEAIEMMRERGGEAAGLLSYPPLSQDDAEALFPGEAFTVQVKPSRGPNGAAGLRIEVAFKDVNALLASPYGRARSLSLKVEGDKLRFASLSGLQAAVAVSESEELGMVPAAAAFKDKKNELAAAFEVALPAPADSSNGTTAGASVSWAMDRSKTKDLAEAVKLFGGVMRAECAAKGIRFVPATPPRLGLLPFAELKEGPTAEKVSLPDAKTVTAAAKFVPYLLSVTRTFDIAGEGGSAGNQSSLLGAVILPRALEPKSWGQVRIDQVLDDQGRDLKYGDEQRHYRSESLAEQLMWGEREEKPGPDLRRFVQLSFKVPSRRAMRLTRIKAAIELSYFGARQIVKLEKAIPKDWIREESRRVAQPMGAETEYELASPRLAELGLKLTGSDVGRARGMTQLSIQAEETRAALLEVQLFDAQGMPWPTFTLDSARGTASRQRYVAVAGSPEPPFSLALLVSGDRAAVEVPIVLENVSLVRQPKAKQADPPRSTP